MLILVSFKRVQVNELKVLASANSHSTIIHLTAIKWVSQLLYVRPQSKNQQYLQMTTENCCQQFFTQATGLKLIKDIGEAIETQKRFNLSRFSDLNQKEQVKGYGQGIYNSLSKQVQEKFSTSNIWLAIFRQFKGSLLLCFLFVQIQMLCRFGLCFLMKYLFLAFREGEKGLTFMYVSLIAFVYIFQGLISQNGWRLIERVSISIKNSITYALYKKILALSAYSLGNKQVGTITNATTEFHDILENRSKFIFVVFATPLTIISLSVFLVTIVGWYSLIGISLLIVCEFFHYHYANYNSGFLDQIQQQKDLRMQILQQLISAYRYVKMQLWEEMLLNKILGIRMNEMRDYLKYGGGISLQIALSQGVSTACMLIILRLTVLYYSQITSIDVILTVLCILQIKLVVIEFSYGISCFYQLQVVITKIKQIFELKCHKMIKIEEKNSVSVINEEQIKVQVQQAPIIQLNNVSIFLSNQPENQNEILSNIQLSVKKGDFVGIYGPVGGGKSTLLNLLASQVPYYSGSFTIKGSVSIAEQQPIIFSQTIRQNILFGKPMDKLFYKKVVQWSCLKKDLDSLPERDMTRIYEGSSNLSGGQKTRIALARCFYANKDILLLDDPLSSLDAVVAKEVVKNLQKLQSLGKTIILVTHLTSYLSDVQNLYVVKNQTLRRKSNNIFTTKIIPGQHIQKKNHHVVKRKSSFVIQDAIRKSLHLQKDANIDSLKYDENSAVNFGFWFTFFRYIYINSYNKLVFTFTLILYILSETLYTIFVLLLSQYDNILKGQGTTVGNQTNFWMFLGILSVLIFLLQMLRTFFLNLSIQLSNQTLHQNGLKNYLSLSITQADAIGQKQVLSRFSTDLGLLDIGLLPQVSNNFIVFFIAVIQSIVISIYNPIMLAFYAAIAILCYAWNRYCYLVVSLTKQLDLQLKSPIIGIFSETMNGLTQINMEKADQYMLKKFNTRLDKSLSVSYGFRKMFRVYCSYGVYIACVFISGCYFLLASTIKTEDIYKLTFAATFLVEINDTISYILSNFVKISSMLASVQRLLIFSQLKEQDKEKIKKDKIKAEAKQKQQSNHKNHGAITQTNFQINGNSVNLNQQANNSIYLQKASLRYLADRPPVLTNISITIKKGQKVAFIGRTAAGKSSMIQLIYRLIQPEKDSIYFIQGENALQMPVEKLRSKFTCIPQSPFLFSDTLRKNIDPFDQHPQAEILEVLNAVQIWNKLQKQQIGLDSDLSKVFESFSTGEKQLICLARAILQNRGYLILDEATSSIDLETDQIMQDLIRERFVGTTIIAVAHRLQTIADFDKIVVLSKGQILEVGSPRQLYERKGEFYTMVNSSQKNSQIIVQKIYEGQKQ